MGQKKTKFQNNIKFKSIAIASENREIVRIPVSLVEIVSQHTQKFSDKWELYFNVYGRKFETYKNKMVSLLEIGVQNGGSLEIWAKYFWNAKVIIGCDIDENCGKLKFDDRRIHVIVGDIKSEKCIKEILKLTGSLDIIIDDGSHSSEDIIKAFVNLFPFLVDGGIYIVEDLHTNYWENFGGGVFNHKTAISFFKRLADVVNYEAWGIGISRTEVLKPLLDLYGVEIDEIELAHIHSIEFVNSMCIIRKEKPFKNSLGRRVISGSIEPITKGFKKLDGTHVRDISHSFKAVFDVENDPLKLLSEKERLFQEIAKLTEDKEKLQNEVEVLQSKVEELMDAEKSLKDGLEKIIVERDSIKNELSELYKEKAELEDRVKGLEEDRSDLHSEIRSLIDILNKKDATIERLSLELENISREKASLEDKVRSNEEIIRSMEKDRNDLQNEITALRRTVQRFESELEAKKIYIDRLLQELKSLSNESKDLRLKLEKLQNDKKDLEDENQTLKEQLSEKENIINKLSQDKGRLILQLLSVKNSFYWKYIIRPFNQLRGFI